jgi:inosose dehydratase
MGTADEQGDPMTTAFLDRVAGAPCSWGICEQPDWGINLPVDRVLEELTSEGLHAIELGDDGFFPDDNADAKALLDSYGVRMLGGFVSIQLHDPSRRDEMVAEAERMARRLSGTGAQFFVSAAVADYDWSAPTPLDAEGFAELARGIEIVDGICADYGLTQVLHPHLGTQVETKRDVDMVLDATDVKWVLDTGHLYIGGTDPVWFVREHGDRVGLVHLKDVRTEIGRRRLAGEITTREGVDLGLFPPLGQGDVPLKETVLAMESRGYTGWYVHEQDTAITAIPAPGAGPVEDLRTSLRFLTADVLPAIS